MPDPEEYIQTVLRRNPYDLPSPYIGATPAPPPPPKKSLRVFVLVLTGVLCLTVVVLSGVLIVVLRSAGQQQEAVRTTPVVVSPTPAATTTAQYYTAIKSQNYTSAYSYLDPNLTASNGQPLTQDLYTTAAQGLDSAKGTVSSFTVGPISTTNDTASVTVSVTRTNAPAYDVHLQLKQESGSWKIISYDYI
jgi:hypothetical protein